MLFLILAILSSVMVSVTMRLGQEHCSGKLTLLAGNYICCTLLSLVDCKIASVQFLSTGITSTVWLGLIGGVFYLAAFVVFQWNVANNGMSLSATFMKLGVLIPTLLAVVWFHEMPQLGQIVGFVLAIIAIFFIREPTGENSFQKKWALPLLLIVGGAADAMSKVYEHYGKAELQPAFLFFIFGSAMVLCLLLCALRKENLGWKEMLFGLLIGLPNYFSSRFLLLSLGRIPAVIAFPTFSVGSILVVTLLGRIFFKEQLSRKQSIALGMILVAIVCLNV